jgi:GT2 family glycosyltransferase
MVFLGYCHPGVVRHEFLRSLLALVQHVGNESFQLIISDAYTGPLISRARCILAETFLATPAQYLLFVDTDIDFEPTFIGKLIAIDKPIVGALYYGVQHSDYSSFPTALLQQEDGYYRPIGVIPDDTAEVDAVGMGFTLIKREVVEAIGADSEKLLPFAEGIWKDRVVGEDLMFCLRAKEKGYSTWLAPQLRVRHMKTIAV